MITPGGMLFILPPCHVARKRDGRGARTTDIKRAAQVQMIQQPILISCFWGPLDPRRVFVYTIQTRVQYVLLYFFIFLCRCALRFFWMNCPTRTTSLARRRLLRQALLHRWQPPSLHLPVVNFLPFVFCQVQHHRFSFLLVSPSPSSPPC